MNVPLFSVVICTHNPHPERLRRTLAGLQAQTLPAAEWETVLVDNASTAGREPAIPSESAPENLRLVAEAELGLTHARRRGIREAAGTWVLMVDDDNVLAPDYLERAREFTSEYGSVGAFGGISEPEFERPPEPWQEEYFDLLALRDLGPEIIIAQADSARTEYPLCSPIGAGMVVRRDLLQQWLNRDDQAGSTDRRGGELTSGGDNEIVLAVCAAGGDVAYTPKLRLIHLIPAGRLDLQYLGRLNHGIQKSWIQVLHRHGIRPVNWSPAAPWTVPLRKLKAWFTYRAWAGPADWVRWRGACGHFEGRALIR
jgi:glycosyltransferase involved in cell wall biosynthesis